MKTVEEIIECLVSAVGEFANVDELAQTLNVSRTTISRKIEAGEIIAFHFGSRVIVVTRSLQGLLEKFLE